MPPINPGGPATPVRARMYILAFAPIRVGAVSRVGEEHRLGVVLPAGLAGPTGMGARGCGVPITARSLLAWRLALSSPLPPLAPSRRDPLPTSAGIGPIRREPAATGTTADLKALGKRPGLLRSLPSGLMREVAIRKGGDGDLAMRVRGRGVGPCCHDRPPQKAAKRASQGFAVPPLHPSSRWLAMPGHAVCC